MQHIKYTTLIFIIGLLLFGNACTRYKNMVYLQEEDSTSHIGNYPYSMPEYKIQQKDILYIKILSMNKVANEMISLSQTSSNFGSDVSFYLYGYNVDNKGCIELPVIGEIEVAGYTLEEAKELIKTKTSNFFKNATVIVKLISFKYSVLGEVNRPGIYTNFNNQLTVLEAISQAGDITDYGDRKKILILRPTQNGTTTFRLDLTNVKILTSNGFFLLPNDIVYVEPVKSKNFRNNLPIISIALSATTTFILFLNYLNNQK